MWHELLINVFEDGAFAAIAAIGFSSISNTPTRAYFTCGITAAAGHAVRYLLRLPELGGMHIVLASFIAALVIGFMAILLTPRIKCPAEVCFFPALLPMIPGMYAYGAVEAMMMCLYHSGETEFNHYLYLLSYNGLTCVFIIIGMVLGATIPIFLFKRIAFQATR